MFYASDVNMHSAHEHILDIHRRAVRVPLAVLALGAGVAVPVSRAEVGWQLLVRVLRHPRTRLVAQLQIVNGGFAVIVALCSYIAFHRTCCSFAIYRMIIS
jgi:hypothetical protein